jgi:hypothetical protein
MLMRSQHPLILSYIKKVLKCFCSSKTFSIFVKQLKTNIMRTVKLYFWNEDELGRETNTHSLEFKSSIGLTNVDDLYSYINANYYMLIETFKYYAVVEEF